ncbi:MAG: S9 family peptidase [SAR202 cluster bacterium]|nr:S9 family peptidase [SAR202 cluster bacterium]
MAGLKQLTAEDVLRFKGVGDANVSPDGEMVAFVVGDSFVLDTKLSRSNIWVVPTSGGSARQLTTGPRSDSNPRWSPDGRLLAFLSDREKDGQRQVFVMAREGGEAVRITDIEGAIPSPRSLDPLAWSPDGSRIAFLLVDADTEEEKRKKKEKFDQIEFEQDPKFARLYVIDVPDISRGPVAVPPARCVSPAGLQIWEFGWSSDGAQFAAVVSGEPFEQSWYHCRLVAFPAAGGGAARTLHKTARQVSKPAWSPDGEQIAFLTSNWSDRGITGGSVYVVPADGGEARDLSKGHVASADYVRWLGNDRVVTTAQETGGFGVADIDVVSGKRRSLWRGDAALAQASTTFSMDREGNVAVVREDPTSPQDVWLMRRKGREVAWTKLTDLHPQAAQFALPTVQALKWKAPDGLEIQGIVIFPPGDRKGPLPTVVIPHGGPTGMTACRFPNSTRFFGMLAAAGMAVFMPNPRGSTGWGLEFAEANIGDMGGKDWEDIVAGIDYCVAKGIAHPDRLGVGGGSYGGFMTGWAITQTDRFKAAVGIAGVYDWRSQHGKSFLSDWDSIHYGGADPWDPDGVYRKFSPITFIKRARTPTLLLHGEMDGDVPVEQSYEFYRALKDHDVQTSLVVYPREHHGFSERAHLIDMYRRTVVWFRERLVVGR